MNVEHDSREDGGDKRGAGEQTGVQGRNRLVEMTYPHLEGNEGSAIKIQITASVKQSVNPSSTRINHLIEFDLQPYFIAY